MRFKGIKISDKVIDKDSNHIEIVNGVDNFHGHINGPHVMVKGSQLCYPIDDVLKVMSYDEYNETVKRLIEEHNTKVLKLLDQYKVIIPNKLEFKKELFNL